MFHLRLIAGHCHPSLVPGHCLQQVWPGDLLAPDQVLWASHRDVNHGPLSPRYTLHMKYLVINPRRGKHTCTTN